MSAHECFPNFKTERRRKPTKMTRDASELRAAKRVLLERSGGRCEVGWASLCTGVGVVAHHRVRRSAGGSNDPSNLLWVCHFDHEAIHANPAWALARGYLKPGWA